MQGRRIDTSRAGAPKWIAFPHKRVPRSVRMHSQHGQTVLVGDIGGTNARLALWSVEGDPATAELYSTIYPTGTKMDFPQVIASFLKDAQQAGPPPSAAVLAVAGAVKNNWCEMTNAKWIIDGDKLSKNFEYGVRLLNDFEAVGYGIPVLQPSDCVILNEGKPDAKAPKVVMGPGTGLGEAQLMWDRGLDDYVVWAGEGAHASFAPRGWKQYALGMYAATKLGGHVEIEHVACGSGLELIYEFLVTDEQANRQGIPLGPSALLNANGQRKVAKDISDAALLGTDPVAQEAVDMLMGIVGAEAGAMALRCLARGGAYIAGGITPRLLPRLRQDNITGSGVCALLEGFLNLKAHKRFREILKDIPLSVITNTKVGQIGARQVAVKLMKRRRRSHAVSI